MKISKGSIARSILNARTYDAQKQALVHWDKFVPFRMSYMTADQNEVVYVEERYESLRQYTYEWFTEQSILDLEARIEALERDYD